MKKIKIGDKVSSKHGDTTITGITLFPMEAVWPDGEEGMELSEIFDDYRVYCVFDLANNHWSWGADIQFIEEEIAKF